MERFHIYIICNFRLQPDLCDFFFFDHKFGQINLLIRCCCDSGYPWRMKIDWLLWFSCENPNSPISYGDVTMLKPGAEATECIREAHRNSTHTLQLVSTPQYDPLVFLNSVKLNSLRSYVSNSDCSYFNHLNCHCTFHSGFWFLCLWK